MHTAPPKITQNRGGHIDRGTVVVAQVGELPPPNITHTVGYIIMTGAQETDDVWIARGVRGWRGRTYDRRTGRKVENTKN